MSATSPSRYTEAGVDIDKGNELVSRIKSIVKSTHQRGVLNDIGGFSGLCAISSSGMEDPVLVTSTDGVGTKLTVAKMCNRHDTIGIDLVAMCVNDVAVCGGRPLCFLDYFATSRLELEVAVDVVKGIAKGCRIAKCSLVGGETAEMPGIYQSGDYDLAGFVVGLVERNEIIDGSDIRVGNLIIGLASSGLHSNGFSLVRKICFEEQGLKVDDYVEELGRGLGEELLEPTRIYSPTINQVLRHHKINGLVHNTGGGFIDNIPRVLPNSTRAVLDQAAWPLPPIFSFLQQSGQVATAEMYRTFNMGIGMLAVVEEDLVEDVMGQFKAMGETPYLIGEIAGHKKESERRVEIKGCTDC